MLRVLRVRVRVSVRLGIGSQNLRTVEPSDYRTGTLYPLQY